MTAYILDRIEGQLDTLSRSEADVGRWVLEHPRRVIDQSIGELAVAAGVSEPTIIRFSRSVGVSGFRELKTRLIANLQRPESYLHHDVDAQDSAIDAAGKVLERSIWALVELREQIPKQPIEAAVEAMAAARQLVFSGLGASGIVAEDACHKFSGWGSPAPAPWIHRPFCSAPPLPGPVMSMSRYPIPVSGRIWCGPWPWPSGTAPL